MNQIIKQDGASKTELTAGSNGCDAMESSGANASVVHDEPLDLSLTGVQPKRKKIFKRDVLRNALMPTLETLLQQFPECLPFIRAVDFLMLQIPHYSDLEDKPTDLSTIERKLNAGEYTDPWQYVNEIRLLFKNAKFYNKEYSDVCTYALTLSKIFDAEIDNAMQLLGYCCGQDYKFRASVLSCDLKCCRIPRDAVYYSFESKYTICENCFYNRDFSNVSTDLITTMDKEQGVKMKNEILEPFVECRQCIRKVHAICVLHYKPMHQDGYVCERCLEAQKMERKPNKYSAKSLASTDLSTYLENKVNNFLKKKKCEAEVIIKVLCNSEKAVKVAPGMKRMYVDSFKMVEYFPYQSKVIFAFQEIDGAEVCFFCMQIQEFGSDCARPNSRRVFISHLDSVHYFQPKNLRTAVYHEIVIGYLTFAKKQGYIWAHIKACPPNDGEDFIFYRHPPEQKFPGMERLQSWYNAMLDKAIAQGCVINYKDIWRNAMENCVKGAADLPYFEGDFWPYVLENLIKGITQDREEACRHVEDKSESYKESGLKENGNYTKGSKSLSGCCKKIKMDEDEQTLTSNLFNAVKEHKQMFIVARLHTNDMAALLPPIYDSDEFKSHDLVDTPFMTSHDTHLEFSSLRRAKFSTLALLYQLHINTQNKLINLSLA